MPFLKISITQKGSIHFTNKYWADLASGHAQIFYGNWRWQGGGWVLGVWICMIRDAWFWFFTISYCILCCRNRLMVFINSLEESQARAGLVMTWRRQKGPAPLTNLQVCICEHWWSVSRDRVTESSLKWHFRTLFGFYGDVRPITRKSLLTSLNL